jgi:hypothetical protein
MNRAIGTSVLKSDQVVDQQARGVADARHRVAYR